VHACGSNLQAERPALRECRIGGGSTTTPGELRNDVHSTEEYALEYCVTIGERGPGQVVVRTHEGGLFAGAAEVTDHNQDNKHDHWKDPWTWILLVLCAAIVLLGASWLLGNYAVVE